MIATLLLLAAIVPISLAVASFAALIVNDRDARRADELVEALRPPSRRQARVETRELGSR